MRLSLNGAAYRVSWTASIMEQAGLKKTSTYTRSKFPRNLLNMLYIDNVFCQRREPLQMYSIRHRPDASTSGLRRFELGRGKCPHYGTRISDLIFTAGPWAVAIINIYLALRLFYFDLNNWNIFISVQTTFLAMTPSASLSQGLPIIPLRRTSLLEKPSHIYLLCVLCLAQLGRCIDPN